MKKLNHMDHKVDCVIVLHNYYILVQFCELQLLLSKRNNPQINRVHKKKEVKFLYS